MRDSSQFKQRVQKKWIIIINVTYCLGVNLLDLNLELFTQFLLSR